MHTNNNHPLLILAPVKKEDLHIETGLSFFHEVLSDKEIKLFQEKASGVVRMSDKLIQSTSKCWLHGVRLEIFIIFCIWL